MSRVESFLPVQNGRLRLCDEGPRDAPALVLLHGFSFDLESWDANVPELSRDHRVVRYDMRGFGRSDLPQGPYDHAGDLAQVIAALGLERPVVMGLSLGANVALQQVARFGQPVSGLILVSPGLPGHVWSEARPPEEAKAFAQENDIAATRDFWLSLPLFASLDDFPEARASVHACVNRYSGWHWMNPDPLEVAPPMVPWLGKVSAPTLILSGQRDVQGYQDIAGVLAEGIAGARLHRMGGVGHCLNVEAPEAFNRMILDFLDTIGTAKGETGGQA